MKYTHEISIGKIKYKIKFEIMCMCKMYNGTSVANLNLVLSLLHGIRFSWTCTESLQ